ncbi:MAG: alpha-D-glucose phosphate-specific phosphoglucomutase, partial [Telluria sp.]
GTGTEGATIRLYLERYEADPARHAIEAQSALEGLARIADSLSQLKQRTGREGPSVVT